MEEIETSVTKNDGKLFIGWGTKFILTAENFKDKICNSLH